MKWQSTKLLLNHEFTFASNREVEGTLSSRDWTLIAFAEHAVALPGVRLAKGETNSTLPITRSVIGFHVREHFFTTVVLDALRAPEQTSDEAFVRLSFKTMTA